jgi:hypothetical protein
MTFEEKLAEFDREHAEKVERRWLAMRELYARAEEYARQYQRERTVEAARDRRWRLVAQIERKAACP